MVAERMNANAQAAPAIDVLCDLDLPGPHKRWVAAIENSPTTPVWFGHRTDSGDRAALVGTLPRGAFASVWLRGNGVRWHGAREADERHRADRLRCGSFRSLQECPGASGRACRYDAQMAPLDVDGGRRPGEQYGADFSVPLTIGQLNRLRAEQMPQPAHPHSDLLRFR
ncbi:hypothetical protein GCM10027360_89050 [Amycolatopsis echigonensis]